MLEIIIMVTVWVVVGACTTVSEFRKNWRERK